ncbi:MAG: restriction endonuclease subunit R [Candidatus Eremiobacteraeota bacterium]|nr:restriction endonuclease subunit R [Candidatus Eremiobacteraeota bacterium]
MKDELVKFIDRLKGENDAILKYSEESTKQGIILPLLQHLGWNPFDTATIFPEYPVGSGKVDYSIRDGGKNKVFIEAKKVSEDLDKHYKQLLQYSFEESVQTAILTNGITWLFYLPLKVDVKWEQRKFFTINIFDQTSDMVARALIDYLSMENVISGKHVENAENVLINEQTRKLILKTLPDVWEKILTDPHHRLIDLISDETEKKCGHRPAGEVVGHFIYRNILGRKDMPVIKTFKPHEKDEIGSAKEQPEKYKTNKIKKNKYSYSGKKPKAFIFDGKRFEVKNWRDLFRKFVNAVRDEDKNDFIKILNVKGRKAPYFTRNPEELRDAKKINESDFYMETNLSANNSIKIVGKIIEEFGFSSDIFQVEL